MFLKLQLARGPRLLIRTAIAAPDLWAAGYHCTSGLASGDTLYRAADVHHEGKWGWEDDV